MCLVLGIPIPPSYSVPSLCNNDQAMPNPIAGPVCGHVKLVISKVMEGRADADGERRQGQAQILCHLWRAKESCSSSLKWSCTTN